MDGLEKHLEIDALLFYYEPLLTEKQTQIMRYYYRDNYSLSEIADLVDTSRNAVHDHIKKTETKLYDYEHKLGLHKKAEKRQKLLEQLKAEANSERLQALIDKLEEVD